jgi:DNA-binding GntR family transcriptional regulator
VKGENPAGTKIEAAQPLTEITRSDLIAERAYEEIREAIFANRLPPGAPLSVPELARQLAISRSPVREAVQRLVHDGLAVTSPYKGAMVARVDVEDLYRLYEVRELLEGLAARLATERLDKTALAELEEILNQHRKVLEDREDLAAHIDLDMRFHRQIREIAGNPHLAAVLDGLQGKIQLAMRSLWRSDDAPFNALRDHEKILAAMSSGDPADAEVVARAHIARVRETLVEAHQGKKDTGATKPQSSATQGGYDETKNG